jgi:hypothetical protein
MNVPNNPFANMPTNPIDGAKAVFHATEDRGILMALILSALCFGGMLLLWWLFDMETLLTLAFGIVVIPTAFAVLGVTATIAGLFAGKKGIQKLLADVQAAVAEKKAAAA